MGKLSFRSQTRAPRLRGDAGLAIGMVLFVVAILAVLAIAMSAGGNFMGTTVTPDRVSADIKTQGNLIRAKILECFSFGFDRGDLADRYPAGASPGVAVSALTCPSYGASVNSLWTGQSPASLPGPTAGMQAWTYVNAGATGGRCIRTQPNAGLTGDIGIKAGLAQAANAFTGLELIYNPSSADQRFILWITRPTGTASTDCGST